MSTPQLPLALRFPPDQRFDGFVGSDPVVALLRAVARGGLADWVYVSGPAGSGKTHLLIAACAEATQCGRRAAYLPLAGCAGQVAEAVAMFEGFDLVCLDGLDAVAGQRGDEIALFDFHNRARSAGSTVLYAAQATPAQLPPGLPDLRSRLGQCAQLTLATLDDDGRRQVLRRRAAARGLELDEAVLDWLLRRVGRDLGTLTALLDRLDRESLAAQRRITIPFLRQLLEP
ncbi:DnaA regulatory inactivator Hda [Rehaibacterium terrae]|uniref:DnaA family protein n=1 Tax=Rehaibacterium terrae TaxID=1341696 RepID=A0A7W7V7G5_9GAMM|nr:DnaA family protein [Rehaibacterium terrae]